MTVTSTSTRRRVLDAAAEVLSRDGIDVSMEVIAEEAGVTRMTVYRQLGTREELLLAVLLDQSATAGEALRAIFEDAGRPFADRVVDAIVLVVMSVRSSPVLSFFVQGVTPTQVGDLDRDNRFMGAVWALLLPYFEDASRRGELRGKAHATLDWTLRQILLQLIIEGTTTSSEAGLRKELRTFFVPSITTAG